MNDMLIRLAFVLIAIIALNAQANEYVWDQVNDYTTPDIYRDIATFSPFGQEFTPSLNCLEIVELEVSNFMSDPARLTINIRSDSITGLLVGTSNTVTIQGYYTGKSTFLFFPVELQPGSKYIIELIRTEGNAGIGGYSPAGYPSGCAVLWGVPYDEIDLWFREGVIKETALHRLTWGSIKTL
ncbi:MAG: hypothetical protein KAR40_16320 [Candidatus Sabulitectum sp.]|nr:hypothetical protein [Candidatus Sabulitectum sp.]